MKRGAIDHPKTLRLAKLLSIERWGAVGILESLWHFAAKHAIQGDVGRWANEQIAEAICWEGDPDLLVSALVTAGLIDTCKKNRLLVHDWKDHCDDAVKKTLRNRELSVLFPENSGNRRKLSGKVPPALAIAKPKPEPSLANGEYTEAFEEFWLAYPAKGRVEKHDTYRLYQEAVHTVDPQVILSAAKEYADCGKVKDGYVRQTTRWIRRKAWEDNRAAWGSSVKTDSAPAQRTFSELLQSVRENHDGHTG